MGRPSKKTPTERTQIVLSVLKGDHSLAETARRHGVSEQAVGNWKRQFLAGGAEAMTSGGTKASSREDQFGPHPVAVSARLQPEAILGP